MEQSFSMSASLSKAERYEALVPQIESLVDGETDEVSVLANVSAALHEALGHLWTGFYLVRDGRLRLGPFQGSVACYSIGKGRGVCGTAWQRGETLVVDDVDAFPGHIACSSLSRSEIVVPMVSGGVVRGVIDIDSRHLSAFDDTDARYLERIADIIARTLY